MSGPTAVAVSGSWPGLVTLRSGWWKGVARPVNDESSDAVLRIERGSVDFVRRAAERLIALGARSVNSPPLFAGTERLFRSAGFLPHLQLAVMERDLRRDVPASEHVHAGARVDLDTAVRIDNAAFPSEWRIGRLGLEDALGATPDSALLFHDRGDGFAIVGVATEMSYLQRIAVDPVRQGQGRGRELVRASLAWARGRGARTMVLNTQLDNERAARMYRSEAFDDLSSRLTIHRFTP